MKPGLFEHFVTIIDRLDPPKRIRKLSNRDVIECAVYVLKTGVAWREAKVPPGTSPMTAYDRYTGWVKSGFVSRAWTELLSMYSARQLKRNPLWFKNLFIDSSMIKNVAGVDCTGANPTDRKRQATKLSTICDEAQVPISALFIPANQSDVTTVEDTVAGIKCLVRKDERYTNVLIGDKGYVCKDTTAYLKEFRIKLLTPPKINAKNKKRSKTEKAQLKMRHRVENLFCRLDKFKRLYTRRESSISMFEAMHQLAFCMITIRQFDALGTD